MNLRSVLILNLLLLLISLTPPAVWLASSFQKSLSPLAASLVSLNRQFLASVRFFSSLPSLKAGKESLTERLSKLEAEKALWTAVQKENELLRGQLSLTSPQSQDRLVLARVVGRRDTGEILVLSAGSREGLDVGQPASRHGVLLGKIVAVDDSQSQLLLTTSAQSFIEVKTANLSARGEVVGNFGNKLKLSKVLPSQQVRVGDSLLEVGSLLLVGRVESVEKEGAKIFKEAVVSVPYEPGLLDEVFVAVE